MKRQRKPRDMASGKLLSWHKSAIQWHLTEPAIESTEEQEQHKYFGPGTGSVT